MPEPRSLRRSLSCAAAATAVLGLSVLSLEGCSLFSRGSSEEAARQKSDLEPDPIPKIPQAHQGKKVGVVTVVSRSLPYRNFLTEFAPDLFAEFLIEAGFRTITDKPADLGGAIEEIESNPTGLVDPTTAQKIGKQLETDLVFVGVVTGYEQVIAKGGSGVSFLRFGIDTSRGSVAYKIKAAGRLVETETGKVVGSKTTAYEKQLEVGGAGLHASDRSGQMSREEELARETGGRVLVKCLNQLMIGIVKQLNEERGERGNP